MLRLEGALRDIQDASASLADLTSARDAGAYQRSFDLCLTQIRGARWKIQSAVKAAARQEPGRPRVDRAAAWWAAQADLIDSDPVLRWAGAGAGAEPASTVAPPTTHLDRPVPVEHQTPEGLLSMCIAHCGDLYDRAMRAWG